MTQILPLTPAQPSPANISPKSTLGTIEFSTFEAPLRSSPATAAPPAETQSPSFVTRFVKFLAPAASYIVPILRFILMKPTPLPATSAETRRRLSIRIRNTISRLIMSASSSISTTSPSRESSGIWVSGTSFLSSTSLPISNVLCANTFPAIERIDGRPVWMCGVEVFNRPIGLGDEIHSPSRGWQNPGRIRQVYALTKTHLVFTWEVERFGSRNREEELLAVPIPCCRLSLLGKFVYRYMRWALRAQTLTYDGSAQQTHRHDTST